jgi:hypothetical protein
MFGFFGYWFGVKTATGVYSSVTIAGFTVIIVWLPIPLNPKKTTLITQGLQRQKSCCPKTFFCDMI